MSHCTHPGCPDRGTEAVTVGGVHTMRCLLHAPRSKQLRLARVTILVFAAVCVTFWAFFLFTLVRMWSEG